MNRVQKLLLSEYSDFEDLVLVESPFAQTTRDGWGLRQVHLGLTPSKLILATDVLPAAQMSIIEIIDPEIDQFELIAIYPVDCVNLTVYRQKQRQILKAHFCNDLVSYFELSVQHKRTMFWNLWCEKVKFLCPGPNTGSSRSESSVATSSSTTSGSVLYLRQAKWTTKKNNVRQLWCKFGPNACVDTRFVDDILRNSYDKWTNKFLYLGKSLHDNPADYLPVMHRPHLDEFLRVKKPKKRKLTERPSQMLEKNLQFGNTVQVNRFGSGVFEGCNAALYLTVDDYVTPVRYDPAMTATTTSSTDYWDSLDYEQLAENAVLLWEYCNCAINRKRLRHRRRYGFSAKPLFLYGLGPWATAYGDQYTLHLKHALSAVNLSSDKWISKRQLVATCSLQDLSPLYCRKPFLLFWTPGFRYRPVSAQSAYAQQRKRLREIQESHEKAAKSSKKSKCLGKRRRKFFKRFQKTNAISDDDNADDVIEVQKSRKPKFISHLLPVKCNNARRETALQSLKRQLKTPVSWTAWDFDSDTLAQQLTLIDSELFLKITSEELRRVLWQKSTENAPNLTALTSFSYRIACLIASEILRGETEKVRARLMARFINVADKCHRVSNFQSCRSVLGGLQCPAVFHLRGTWAYARKKHASKYQIFEYLCRLYRDPRMPVYDKTFLIFAQQPPFLPSVGHLVVKLLGKMLPCKPCLCASKSSTKTCEAANQENFFQKLYKLINPAAAAPAPSGNGGAAGDRIMATKKLNAAPLLAVKRCDEDARAVLWRETSEFLERCQLAAVKYNTFDVNRKAREFLLRARHFEDEHNFFNSLSLEDNKNV